MANGTTKKHKGDIVDSRVAKEANGGVLPWNAVRIRWAADESRDEEESFTWSLLYAADFNEEHHLGWRYDKSELIKLRAERLAAARK